MANSVGPIVVITKVISSWVFVTDTAHGKTNNNHIVDGTRMIKNMVGVYILGKVTNSIKDIFRMD